VPSIIVANDADHTRGESILSHIPIVPQLTVIGRKVLSHAFSERSLNGEERLLQNYVDQLVSRLRETIAAKGDAVDMVKWYNWTTFDIIADLVFGKPSCPMTLCG
jgi:hypothetical protein